MKESDHLFMDSMQSDNTIFLSDFISLYMLSIYPVECIYLLSLYLETG